MALNGFTINDTPQDTTSQASPQGDSALKGFSIGGVPNSVPTPKVAQAAQPVIAAPVPKDTTSLFSKTKSFLGDLVTPSQKPVIATDPKLQMDMNVPFDQKGQSDSLSKKEANLTALKTDIESTQVDKTDPQSVSAYKAKVKVLNDSFQDYKNSVDNYNFGIKANTPDAVPTKQPSGIEKFSDFVSKKISDSVYNLGTAPTMQINQETGKFEMVMKDSPVKQWLKDGHYADKFAGAIENGNKYAIGADEVLKTLAQASPTVMLEGVSGGIYKDTNLPEADNLVAKTLNILSKGVGMVGGIMLSDGAIAEPLLAKTGIATILNSATNPLVAKYAVPLIQNAIALGTYGQLNPELGTDIGNRLKTLGTDFATAPLYTALGAIKSVWKSVPASAILGFGMAKLSGANNNDALASGVAFAMLDGAGKSSTKTGKGLALTNAIVDDSLRIEATKILNNYARTKIDKTSSEEAIRKAYLDAVTVAHPDKAGGSTKDFQYIQSAYDLLTKGRGENFSNMFNEETKSHVRTHGTEATSQAMQENLGIKKDIADKVVARNKPTSPLENNKITALSGFEVNGEVIDSQAKGSEQGVPSSSMSTIVPAERGDHFPSLSIKADSSRPLESKDIRYTSSPSLKNFDSISHYVTTTSEQSKANEKPFIEQIKKVTGFIPETRIKTPESITGKADRLAERGKDYTTTHDILAGRVVVPLEKVSEVIKSIEKNFNVSSTADHRVLDSPYGYFGTNIRVILPNGLKAEIQVHTPHSLGHSIATHKLYEKYRNIPTNKLTEEQKIDMQSDILKARKLATDMRAEEKIDYTKSNAKENYNKVTGKRDIADTTGNKEGVIGNAKLIRNYDTNRVQLDLGGKPSETIRNTLKSKGFKWAPSTGTWQRILTGTAVKDARTILENIASTEGATSVTSVGMGSTSRTTEYSKPQLKNEPLKMRGFVNAGEMTDQAKTAVKKISDIVEHSQKIDIINNNISDAMYREEGANKALKERLIQFIKENSKEISARDAENVYHYLEDHSIVLSDDERKRVLPIAQKMDSLLEGLRDEYRELGGTITKDIQGEQTPRYAKGKGGVIDKLVERKERGEYATVRQGGILSKSLGQGNKHRVFHALVGENGNRIVVAIKDKKVTGFSNKRLSDMGSTEKIVTPVVKEFYDKKVTPVLETLAKDLGIKHIRATGAESGLSRNSAGVSYQGLNTIKTRAGAPERTLIHEIGHQLDYRYDLKSIFNDKTLPVKYMPHEDIPNETATPAIERSVVQDKYEQAKAIVEMDKERLARESHAYKTLKQYTVKDKDHEFRGELPEITGKEVRKAHPKSKSHTFAKRGDGFVEEALNEAGVQVGDKDARDVANDFLKSFEEFKTGLKGNREELAKAYKEKRNEDEFNKFLNKGATKFEKSVSRPKKVVTEYNAAKELRAVADLRLGDTYTPSFKAYVRNGDEKIAALFEAYLHVPDKFQEVAPNTFAKFEEFLNDHKELHPILDLEPSLALGSRKIGGEHKAGLVGSTFVDNNGMKYTIDQATTKEIEQHTSTEYHKDFLVNYALAIERTARAVRVLKFLNKIKDSPEFSDIIVKNDGLNEIPHGWKTTKLQQFHGYYFEPKTAEVFDDFARRQEGGVYIPVYDEINNFLISAIVINPIMHFPNVGMGWASSEAGTGVAPMLTATSRANFARAVNAVKNMNEDYLTFLEHGAPLMHLKGLNKEFADTLLERLSNEVKTSPSDYEKVAKVLNYANPVEWAKGMSHISETATWTGNDVMLLHALYDHMSATGSTMEQAITQVSKRLADYRVPSRVGPGQIGRVLSLAFQNNSLFMFSRFHYSGVIKPWLENIQDSFNPRGEETGGPSTAQRKEGLRVLAFFAFMGLVVYPVINKMLQNYTGEKNTYMSQAGAMRLPQNIRGVLNGSKTSGNFLQSILTWTPGVKIGASLWAGRDVSNGNPIDGPGGEGYTALVTSNISPYVEARKAASGQGNSKDFMLSMGGVFSPKSSSAEKTRNNMVFIEKPQLSAKIKEHIIADDEAGAMEIAREFNKRLKVTIKEALIENGKSGSDAQVQAVFEKDAISMPGQKAIANYQALHGKSFVDKVFSDGKPQVKENVPIENTDLISGITVYAKAITVDPVTAFHDIFHGQIIRKVDNNVIIVKREAGLRNSIGATEEEKNGMILDHRISLELGGTNEASNLVFVEAKQAKSDDIVENYLGKALKSGKIDKATAQKLELDYKSRIINYTDVQKTVDK